jgi:ribosomal protein S12
VIPAPAGAREVLEDQQLSQAIDADQQRGIALRVHSAKQGKKNAASRRCVQLRIENDCILSV